MKRIVLVFLLWLPAFSVVADDYAPYAMPRTEVVLIKDNTAGKQYELYIKLPENYAANADKRYPVIYTTDAVWHMDLLSGTAEYLMPNAILVGISWQKDAGDERAHQSRFRDYTTYESSDAERQAQNRYGQARGHLAFIRNDVITYVDEHYRTVPEQRGYLGYSLGGAFGAYILFAAPDTFSHYILGSPALGQRSYDVIDELEAKLASEQQEMTASVFVSIGELEQAEDISFAQKLMTVLKRRKQTGLVYTDLQVIKKSTHGTAVPETFIRGIKWFSQLISK